jgi:hypothetical protein
MFYLFIKIKNINFIFIFYYDIFLYCKIYLKKGNYENCFTEIIMNYF